MVAAWGDGQVDAVTGLATGSNVALALAGLWIVVAALLSLFAARRVRQAARVVASSHALRNMLDLSPSRPLVVYPDGSVQADPRLVRELGLVGQPDSLEALSTDAAGLDADDARDLAAAVETAALSGSALERQVRLAGSDRVLEVRGGPAPAPEPAGTLILWFSDTTTAESERLKTAQRLRQTETAVDALTQLIEAAPFPMWYRGPDLKLGLVNSAYVEAVEGRDAAEVIATRKRAGRRYRRGDGARRCAALETGQPTIRRQPAIIRGERRMLQIVNVPLRDRRGRRLRRSTSRTSRTRAASLPATSSRSATLPTG